MVLSEAMDVVEQTPCLDGGFVEAHSLTPIIK
jgi:hypothetical protein